MIQQLPRKANRNAGQLISIRREKKQHGGMQPAHYKSSAMYSIRHIEPSRQICIARPIPAVYPRHAA